MQPPLQQMMTDNADCLPALLLGFAKVVQEHFYAPEHIHFQRLLIQVLVQKPELYATLKQRPTGRVLQALAEILKQYQALGRIQLDNPTLQATAFLGAVMGYPLPAALIDQQPMDSRVLEPLAHSAVQTFLTAWRYH
ncbi:TetR/AcrR family transcriptional regulator C-terminal domain-containing protein [Citrobacter farmeri]